METREFLKRYAYVYCYAVSLCLVLAVGIRGTVSAVSSRQDLLQENIIIVDPGHGGIDGGAVSCTGMRESDLNLQIARKEALLLRFWGFETVMTRSTEASAATEGETIREQKRSDLRNRVELVSRYPNGTLLSIHQNQFADSQYSGPQVFYADTDGSKDLAQTLQKDLNRNLSPGNTRTCKPVKGVYLMNHVPCRAILVECGFLSNPAEEAKLRSDGYQKKLCCVLTSVLAGQTEPTALR